MSVNRNVEVLVRGCSGVVKPPGSESFQLHGCALAGDPYGGDVRQGLVGGRRLTADVTPQAPRPTHSALRLLVERDVVLLGRPTAQVNHHPEPLDRGRSRIPRRYLAEEGG